MKKTAAILASNIDMKKGGKFAVADFGGATTDFSIAAISIHFLFSF